MARKTGQCYTGKGTHPLQEERQQKDKDSTK